VVEALLILQGADPADLAALLKRGE